MLCPVLEIELLGYHSESSIFSGTLELLSHRSWLVGGAALLFSVIFPMTKTILLLELSLMGFLHRRHIATTLKVMEHAGTWRMMDVMLRGFLVMIVRLGKLVEFHFGPAVVAFFLCVTMSMIASLPFDPHAIWEASE